MVRPWLVLPLVVVALVAAAGSGPAGVATGAAAPNATDGGGTHVSAAVGAEAVRFEGAARRAAFERELSGADTAAEEAAVIARQLDDSEARLERLRRRHDELTAARENGSLGRGEYAVRLARLDAAVREVERMAGLLERAAAPLSDQQLRDAGAPRADVRELGAEASALRNRTAGAIGARGDARLYADLATLTERYNARVDARSTDRVGRQLRGEVVDFRVASGDGTVTASFRIDETGRITELRAGSRADATLRMRTDAETVRRLARADDPVGAFRRAVADDDVRITGIGPVNWIKWAILDLLA